MSEADSPTSQKAQAEELLWKHWRHQSFRPGQWETIQVLLEGRDAFAIFPTGGGKSICYQVPALMMEGLTLVVSPLIALMQDQVAGLRARGIPATFINSTLKSAEIDQRWNDAEFGRYRLLYLAPERLQSDLFLARAERLPVSLLAVDEAHCVSEWGRHFRPAYQQIAEARALINDPPTLAVTATATPEVRRDIVTLLGLRSPDLQVRGFDRPNIVWSIFKTENKKAKLLNVVQNVPGSGLVYAGTRRGTKYWAEWLTEQGVLAEAYHGGLTPEERREVQNRWIQNQTRVVAATNAFGMGIDKPDVRFVVHVDLPASLEAYYQEAGRGGRDGKKAYAVLLFQDRDEEGPRGLIEEGHPTAQDVQRVYTAVCNLGQIPLGVLPEQPVPVDTAIVARMLGKSGARVSAAVEQLVRQGAWQRVPEQTRKGYIWFTLTAGDMRTYAETCVNPALGEFVRELLRIVHADAFFGWWELDLRLLERRTNLKRPRLLRGMKYLEELGLIRWRPPGTALRIELIDPRTEVIPVDDLMIRRARRRADQQLKHMLRYARSVACRRHFLLGYFGEAGTRPCGTCDVCLGRHEPVVVTANDEPLIRHLLHQIDQQVDRERWDTPREVPERRIDHLLDWLVQEGYLDVPEPFDDRFELTEKARNMMAQWRPRQPAKG